QPRIRCLQRRYGVGKGPIFRGCDCHGFQRGIFFSVDRKKYKGTHLLKLERGTSTVLEKAIQTRLCCVKSHDVPWGDARLVLTASVVNLIGLWNPAYGEPRSSAGGSSSGSLSYFVWPQGCMCSTM
ncbi:hypothetical protein T310_9073, partial [Rasamsonia emersonii CBS 393.64]